MRCTGPADIVRSNNSAVNRTVLEHGLPGWGRIAGSRWGVMRPWPTVFDPSLDVG
jgi:hypothetical protein